MPQPRNRRTALCSLLLSLTVFASPAFIQHPDASATKHADNPKIQVAILLDVSGSMTGLIDQAKNQLWNMVNILGKVTCNGKAPKIEIALYEYGRSTNSQIDGYIRQISPFTNDLDMLFRELIGLTTNGSEEYCGQVIYNSLTQLSWDTLSSSYKVIFIAGNESFLQGKLSFTKACEEARKKGVIVNTIFCGQRDEGIKENWDLAGECGNGSYSNIDQNAKTPYIRNPYDDSIYRLKDSLNETFIVYGKSGRELYNRMTTADTIAVYNLNDPTKLSDYVVVKSNHNLISNPKWDLVDAMEINPSIIDTLDMRTLHDSLKHKSRAELKKIVEQNIQERRRIRNRITELALRQQKFIKQEEEKQNIQTPQTLESEIQKIIGEQVKRVNMKIE